MIQLTKGPVPEPIALHGTAWTAKWVDHVENGTPISIADKGRYRHPEVKDAVVAETHGKCAYCESKVRHTYPGDVEHILPKRQRPDLFVDWDNLTLGCNICNNRKGDYYDPDRPIVHPYGSDPREHLVFHGPVSFHAPGSAEGELTNRLLELSRAGLIERRYERISALKWLIDRWIEMEEGQLKDLLLQEIRKELGDDKEYTATLRAFAAAHAGITV